MIKTCYIRDVWTVKVRLGSMTYDLLLNTGFKRKKKEKKVKLKKKVSSETCLKIEKIK